MDLFDEGAHQGFPIQADLVFAFDLGEDFGDVEGLAGLSQYVNNPIHIGHPFLAFGFGPLRLWILHLADDAELGRKQ